MFSTVLNRYSRNPYENYETSKTPSPMTSSSVEMGGGGIRGGIHAIPRGLPWGLPQLGGCSTV